MCVNGPGPEGDPRALLAGSAHTHWDDLYILELLGNIQRNQAFLSLCTQKLLFLSKTEKLRYVYLWRGVSLCLSWIFKGTCRSSNVCVFLSSEPWHLESYNSQAKEAMHKQQFWGCRAHNLSSKLQGKSTAAVRFGLPCGQDFPWEFPRSR